MQSETTVNSSQMTRLLLRLRLRRFANRMRHLEGLSALLMVALLVVGAVVVVDGLQRLWLAKALASDDMAFRRAEVLAAALRMGTLLAGVISFTTFSDLWRNDESDVLGRMPVPPVSMFWYRLSGALFSNIPLLLMGVLAMAPLALAGDWLFFTAGSAYLGVIYLLSHIWGFYWHVTAARGVAEPEVSVVRQMSAGTVTAPERAMLLYSPMFAMGTAFAIAYLFFLGLVGLFDGTAMGPFGVIAALIGVGMGLKKGVEAFEGGFYLGAAALADGELIDGVFSESVPGPSYFGVWYATRLPAALAPLVIRDLKQAWRRNRLIPWAYVGASVLMGVAAEELGEWFWALLLILVVAAGAEAIRMAKAGTDAAWMWFTLPESTGKQLLARAAAAFLYGLVMLPGLLWGMTTLGLTWTAAVILPLLMAGLTLLGSVLSVAFYARALAGWMAQAALSGVVIYGAYLWGGLALHALLAMAFGIWALAIIGYFMITKTRWALGYLLEASQGAN